MEIQEPLAACVSINVLLLWLVGLAVKRDLL